MTHRTRLETALLFCAGLLACISGPAAGAILYEQTITQTFVATTSTDGNSNCRASEGCMGKSIGDEGSFAFVIDDINNGSPDGVLPDVLIFNFTLTPAEQAAIKSQPGVGTLIVVAARDIGRRQKPGGGHEDPTEWIDSRFNDVIIGTGAELFRNVLSTCPAAHSESTADLSCGPNFNTDVKSRSTVGIPFALFQAAADHTDIEVELDPTVAVGRLKIASVTLRYESVPEPSSLLLLAAGGLALRLRRRESTC